MTTIIGLGWGGGYRTKSRCGPDRKEVMESTPTARHPTFWDSVYFVVTYCTGVPVLWELRTRSLQKSGPWPGQGAAQTLGVRQTHFSIRTLHFVFMQIFLEPFLKNFNVSNL